LISLDRVFLVIKSIMPDYFQLLSSCEWLCHENLNLSISSKRKILMRLKRSYLFQSVLGQFVEKRSPDYRKIDSLGILGVVLRIAFRIRVKLEDRLVAFFLYIYLDIRITSSYFVSQWSWERRVRKFSLKQEMKVSRLNLNLFFSKN